MVERARELGFLGPGDVGRHVAHARAMGAVPESQPQRFLDLGSGGGVPGLALLEHWPQARAGLLEARERRAAFLRRAVEQLGLVERAEVLEGRAEQLARRDGLRGGFDLVVARSFGPPAVTAECAVGFLAPSGLLVVAEPPEEGPSRWDRSGLAELGLAMEGSVRRDGFGFARFRLRGPVADRWPRRAPHTRPLWR